MLRAFQAPGKARRDEQSFGVQELLPHLCDPTGSKMCRGKGWSRGQEKVGQVASL